MLLRTKLVLALVIAGVAPATLAAQTVKDYPNRPIRLIMPNAPGSSNDAVLKRCRLQV